MVRAWQHLLTDAHLEVTSAASYRSALLTERSDMTVVAAMANAQFQPSGKRSRVSIGAQIGTGRQPRGRALPQLVPDLLGPEAHLSVAQAVTHPVPDHQFCSHQCSTRWPSNRSARTC